jgi:hypothetical protein
VDWENREGVIAGILSSFEHVQNTSEKLSVESAQLSRNGDRVHDTSSLEQVLLSI